MRRSALEERMEGFRAAPGHEVGGGEAPPFEAKPVRRPVAPVRPQDQRPVEGAAGDAEQHACEG